MQLTRIKPVIFFTISLLLISSFSIVQAASADAREALINALSYDQQHRLELEKIKHNNEKNKLVVALKNSQQQLDQRNIITLQQIVSKLGRWPGINDVGENPAKIAMLLFKRASSSQQTDFLPLMLNAVKLQNLPASWYAEAYDHHLMRQNLPQKYGNLMIKSHDNSHGLYPINSFDEVAQNRKTLGLPSLQSKMGSNGWLLRKDPNANDGVVVQTTSQLMKMSDLALKCINKVYPNSIKHVLNNDSDAQSPDKLYATFYGCFDWHSSVHGHWLLVRLAKLFPNHKNTETIKSALAAQFTTAKLQAELLYFQQPGRAGFERPYGLAWFLQLFTELHGWQDPQAQQWLLMLTPLKDHMVKQLSAWIPKLAYPIRTGEHSQTAFAFGLALDYARKTNDLAFERILLAHSQRLYLKDTQCPINYEPSGQDFLSACLAEADLMRRVLDRSTYSKWLQGFLPEIKQGVQWLKVAQVTDRSDGKLAHLDGLNLSRAWMMEGIASGLETDDKRYKILFNSAQLHAQSGLSAVTGEHYAGGHWLGSFATYYLSQRGLQ